MDIINWILTYWHDILIGVIIACTLLLAVLKFINTIGPTFAKMTAPEKIAYTTRLIENLSSIAISLVTNAEIKYGGGTGEIKRAQVLNELYALIPDEYKKYVTEKNLSTVLEKALDKAEYIWSDTDVLSYIKEHE